MPRRAVIAKEVEPSGMTVEQLDDYYRPENYAKGLYALMRYPFLKGHGTENDFVLLPDHDGTIHGELPPARVARALRPAGRHRRRRRAPGDPVAGDRPGPPDGASGSWTTATPTGRSRRCAATASGCSRRYLVDEGLVDGAGPIPVGTRDGVKTADRRRRPDHRRHGRARRCSARRRSRVGGRTWPARHVAMGNPHAVAFVDDLADAGPAARRARPRPGGLPRGRQRRVRRTPRRRGTSRCACTSAARARPGPAAPAPAR